MMLRRFSPPRRHDTPRYARYAYMLLLMPLRHLRAAADA